jgi:hypothetical protein
MCARSRSHSRPALREESSPSTADFRRFVEWIPPAGRDGNDWRFVRDTSPNDTTTPARFAGGIRLFNPWLMANQDFQVKHSNP